MVYTRGWDQKATGECMQTSAETIAVTTPLAFKGGYERM